MVDLPRLLVGGRGRVDTLDWPAMVLGAVGAEFEAVTPPELTEHLRRIGECFTRSTARPSVH